MKDSSTMLAFEVLNLDDKGVDLIKEKVQEGVRLKVLGERLILYPVSNALTDTVYELGVDIDPDTVEFKLVYFDEDSEEIADSKLINTVPDITLNDDGTVSITDVPAVIQHLVDNSELVDNEKATIVKPEEQEEPSEDIPEEDEDNASDDQSSEQEGDDDGFLSGLDKEFDADTLEDDATSEENDDSSDNEDDEIMQAANLEDDNSSDENSEEDSDDDEFTEDELNEMFNDDEDEDQDNEEPLEAMDKLEASKDPLMQAAIDIFERKTSGSVLPSFDAKTKALLNEGIVEAGNHLTNARYKAIQQIYSALKLTHDQEYEDAVNGAIADAKDKRDSNIEKIKGNEKVNLEKIANQERRAYEQRKHEAGQAILKEFEAKYDQEHLDELDSLIAKHQESVHAGADNDIKAENQALDDYLETVNKSIFQHVVENANVQDVIDGYNRVVDSERARLVEEAKRVNEENRQLKKQIEDLNSALSIQKNTSASAIKAEVAEKVNEATHHYAIQIEEEIKKRRNAESKKDESEAKVLAQQEKINDLTSKLADLSKDLAKQSDENRELAERIKSERSNLPERVNLIAPAPQPQTQPIQPAKSGSKTKDWLTIVLLFFAVISFGTGIGAMFMVKNQPVPTVQTTTPAPSSKTKSEKTTASADANKDDGKSDDSSSQKTFTYTAKDGKQYAVIKDDSNSGHYIDDKGVTHTVVFK